MMADEREEADMPVNEEGLPDAGENEDEEETGDGTGLDEFGSLIEE